MQLQPIQLRIFNLLHIFGIFLQQKKVHGERRLCNITPSTVGYGTHYSTTLENVGFNTPSVCPGVLRTSNFKFPNSTISPGFTKTSALQLLDSAIKLLQPGKSCFNLPLPVTPVLGYI
uniref:Uncharacterized protein n=1 Tax=Romanomermis culicivorax TaxID=13658 RepID=A0A915KM13_ROMCU